MSYVHLFCGTAVVATLSGCLLHQQLGDLDTDGTTTTGDPGTTANGDSHASFSSSSTASSDATLDTGDAAGDATAADTADEADAPENTGEPAETCFDYAPPPLGCEAHGDAIAQVTGDELPLLDDEPCTVVSVESIAVQDTVTLDCGELYALQILTSAPHLEPPLSEGEEVRLTARYLQYPFDGTVGSFVIRSPEGELLLAYVNQIDWQLDVDVNVDIAPVEVAVATSGCATWEDGELCDENRTISLQRSTLELGNAESPVQLFDGSSTVVPAGASDVAVIAETVETVVCLDDGCGGNEAGPFERISFLIVALPAE